MSVSPGLNLGYPDQKHRCAQFCADESNNHRQDGENPLFTSRRGLPPLTGTIQRSMARFSSSDFDRSKTIDRPSGEDRKSTRLNSSHGYISYAVFCLKKKK